VTISSDSDEYGDTTRPGRKQSAKSRYDSYLLLEWLSQLPNPFSARITPPTKEAKQLDDDIEDLLDGSSVPFDSIMDSDSEEEEDEVNDLLAKV
jgi:hypothetical protein